MLQGWLQCSLQPPTNHEQDSMRSEWPLDPALHGAPLAQYRRAQPLPCLAFDPTKGAVAMGGMDANNKIIMLTNNLDGMFCNTFFSFKSFSLCPVRTLSGCPAAPMGVQRTPWFSELQLQHLLGLRCTPGGDMFIEGKSLLMSLRN